MTHDEIWDDSALVNSWNEALAEYKKYHSIHTTKGNDGDLPSPEKHAMPEARIDGYAESPSPSRGQEAVHGPDASSAAITNDPINTTSSAVNGVERDAAGQRQNMRDAMGGASLMPSPEALLGCVHDESLKKLLMSWYYAGFYTGLYEGQQKQESQPREAR